MATMLGEYEFGYYRNPRGPWFRKPLMESDGLERYYVRKGPKGKEILLSNNMTWQDREALANIHAGARRNNNICNAISLYAGFEVFASMYKGKRFKVRAGMGIFWLIMANIGCFYYSGKVYRPLMNAYFHKYSQEVKSDYFDLKDRKREWFEIDTSVPTNYSSENVAEQGYHMHHGPQPEGEVFQNSWLEQMDKFLKGEPNTFKKHPYYLNYKFEQHERAVPTPEQVDALFARPSAPPSAHRSNLANI